MVVPPFIDGLNMFKMDNRIKMDDLGVPPHFRKSPYVCFSNFIGKHDQQCFEGIHPMVFTSKLGWLFWTPGNRLTCVIVNLSWHGSQSISYLIYYDILWYDILFYTGFSDEWSHQPDDSSLLDPLIRINYVCIIVGKYPYYSTVHRHMCFDQNMVCWIPL